jgi:nicotinate-nucleotide adenylyltransferase
LAQVDQIDQVDRVKVQTHVKPDETHNVQPRIGLLGGSFDPIHNAHIKLACAARDYFNLDLVMLIPAGQPWQRDALQVNAYDRMAMVKLAITNQAKLSACSLEIDRNGPTYTIETLKALDPKARYYWILGADQLNNFCTWHKWSDIAERVTLVVAQRPLSTMNVPKLLQEQINKGSAKLVTLPFEPLAVSASDIRNRLLQKQSVETLLDKPVLKYIEAHNLYGTKPEK